MSGRAFTPDVDGLQGAAAASEIAVSAPFSATMMTHRQFALTIPMAPRQQPD